MDITVFFIKEEFRIALGLYIDVFEVSNPLETFLKRCVTFTGLHPNYCLSLHSIHLAILCETSVVKKHGYGKILLPLIQDLVTLEEQDLYLKQPCLQGFQKTDLSYLS